MLEITQAKAGEWRYCVMLTLAHRIWMQLSLFLHAARAPPGWLPFKRAACRKLAVSEGLSGSVILDSWSVPTDSVRSAAC